MAFIHGKNSYVQVDNSAGTLVDLSSYIDNVDFSQPLETAEVTTFGDSAKEFIAGLKDGSFSLSGKFDPTLDAHMNGVVAALAAGTLASASVVYGPQGSTSGQVKYTFEAIVTGYDVSAPVGDVLTWSAECQITGAITRTTFA